MLGVDDLSGFRAGEMFSSVTERHTDEDIEESFMVGTRSTTPPLSDVVAVWPKPWVFFKVLVTIGVAALFLGACVVYFQNINAIPGFMILGSFSVPLAILLFYFEVNVPRNVSLYQVFKLVMYGGTFSLVVALFGYQTSHVTDIIGASGAGIVEEIGKLAGLMFVVRNLRYPWILNGLLFGGAVGAGFAGFESAGYALTSLLREGGGITLMLENITMRGLLSPGGHVAWAALYGAALWKVKGSDPFQWGMLTDWRFLRVLLFCMTLHAIWDITTPFDLVKDFALLVVAVTGVFVFVQDGLKQVQLTQIELAAEAAA